MTRGSYVYDLNNFLISETHDNNIGDNEFISGTTYYKNDAQGNRIEESSMNSLDISAEVSAEINFDDNNFPTESKTEDISIQNSTSSEKITYEYEYDENNNIIKQIRYGIGGTKLIHGFKYDSFGNILERISFDENEKPALKTVFEYSK